MPFRTSVWLIILLAGVILFLIPSPASAQDPSNTNTTQSEPIEYSPDISFPEFQVGKNVVITKSTIGQYVRSVFIVFVSVVAVLAVVMVIFGGVKWVAAAGNPAKISDAKDVITNAIIGLVIALTSVILLNLINPQLTEFADINLPSTNQKLFAFIQSIKAQAGTLEKCPASTVRGGYTQVCSGVHPSNPGVTEPEFGCLNVNGIINRWVGNDSPYQGMDPFVIKAIIKIESPKQNSPAAGVPTAQPYSGPEGNTNNGRPGPGYGIGQFKSGTLIEQLARSNPGGLPPGCRKNEYLDPDGIHLSKDCKKWLDGRSTSFWGIGWPGLDVQVGLIAGYFSYQMNDRKCVKGDPILAAAAYNQGRGGASDTFCSTTYLNNPEKRAVVAQRAHDYIAKFKQAYKEVCQESQS